jgi:hypothetical protein
MILVFLDQLRAFVFLKVFATSTYVVAWVGLSVATLTLGSRPKQGFVKVWAKNEVRESHFMLLGV